MKLNKLSLNMFFNPHMILVENVVGRNKQYFILSY